MSMSLPYQVTQIARILSYTSFSIPPKRASQGLTVTLKYLVTLPIPSSCPFPFPPSVVHGPMLLRMLALPAPLPCPLFSILLFTFSLTLWGRVYLSFEFQITCTLLTCVQQQTLNALWNSFVLLSWRLINQSKSQIVFLRGHSTTTRTEICHFSDCL